MFVKCLDTQAILVQNTGKKLGGYLIHFKEQKNLGLFYYDFPAVLERYYASDNKSTVGWIFTMAKGGICWASKKQTCITHSTMESEFIALEVA